MADGDVKSPHRFFTNPLGQGAQNVYTEYPDPRRDEWETKIRPALKKTPSTILQKKNGLSRMMFVKARTGRTRPYRKNQELLAGIVRKTGLYLGGSHSFLN